MARQPTAMTGTNDEPAFQGEPAADLRKYGSKIEIMTIAPIRLEVMSTTEGEGRQPNV